MKTMRFFFKLLLPLGLMAILFQGCYTQLMTSREEYPSYREEQQSAGQYDSTYYGEDNDNWQTHQYIGFSYYYPSWRSYWAWDYGCVYPTYWDPWWWGSIYFPYDYYPHYWGYRYPSYGYYGHHNLYGHSYASYTRPYRIRNSGYQRGGGSRGAYGTVRLTPYGDVGSVRGNVNRSRVAGAATQTGRYGATKNTQGRSTTGISGRGNSTNRQRGGWYNPSVQQPRHRDQTRSSERSSSPSYSPRPSSRPSSAPSSPSPRNDGGGRSGGGERSSGGRDSGRQR